MWDFAGLNTCEDQKLFRNAPTEYTFGRPGTTIHIEQRRLPDETRPEDTGSEVWPAAVALARYLEQETLHAATGRVASLFEEGGAKINFRDIQRGTDTVAGRSILELGAGMGLVGLAARALGARRVIMTDIQEALPGLQRNLDLNPSLKGIANGTPAIEATFLDWKTASLCIHSLVAEFAVTTNRWKGARAWTKAVTGGTVNFDMILASDCVVWPELSGPLRATLTNLLHDGNMALFSIVNRCREAVDFPQWMRCHFNVEEVWSSRAKGKQPEGHIKIYRASRKPRLFPWRFASKPERDVADLMACVDASRSRDQIEVAWTYRSLEHILGAKPTSIGEIKVTAGTCWLGAHSLSCRLTLVLSMDARKGWRGKLALPRHMAEACNLPPSIIVKRVVPAELTDRHSDDWAYCASGYIAEQNFYRLFADILHERGVRVPRCYSYWEQGRKQLAKALEQYASFESSNAEKGVNEELMRCRFAVVMEDLAPPRWEQYPTLSEPHARGALGLLASLHGATLGDAELLARAQKELRHHGGYWATSFRDQAELAKLDTIWSSFIFQFAPLDEEFFAQPGIVELASRLRKAQAEVDFELGRHVAEDEKHQTHEGLVLLHGDLRAHHLFFATGCETNLEVQKMRSAQKVSEKTTTNKRALPPEEALEAACVGFRWCGPGLGAQDVAHLLICSVDCALLDDGSAVRWLIITAYLEPLRRQVGAKLAPTPKQFFRTFRLACLDYAKVAIGHHLAGYDPARIRKGKTNLRRPAHNRSMSHLLGYLRFIDRLLDGQEVPGFGPPSTTPLATPAVVIAGASGPDADYVNGTYELQGAFQCEESEPPLFLKVDTMEPIWLYLAQNGTWCVSSAKNKDARASICWAHSAPLPADELLLPSVASCWQVTTDEDWQPQDLRIMPRLLIQSKEAKQRSDAEK